MNGNFLISRLVQMMATIAVMSFVVYMLIGLMPGDPVDMMAAGNPHMTPEDVQRLREIYGLDQPLAERYARWALQLLSGDAGYSRLYGLPVGEVLWPRLLNTGILMVTSLLLTVAIALPLGVYAAAKKGSPADRVINLFCLTGMSMPAFWLALMLIAVFVVKLGWFAASASLDNPISMILPVMTLTLAGLASYVRHMRAAMDEALKAAHIRTAFAKGCAERQVVWGHAFKNALPPVVTLLMLDLGTLFGGAVTIETIFAYPGMGKLMFDAVMGNDFNLALMGFLLLTFCVMLGNLMADIVHALMDPRVNK